jgi:hypothetical protein
MLIQTGNNHKIHEMVLLCMPNMRNTVDIGVWKGQAGDIKHAITVNE